MPELENTAAAWLLRAADNIQLCIGLHQAAEYIEAPTLHAVPMAPSFSNSVLFWRDRIIPVIDMNILAGNTAMNSRFIMVTAYQEKDNVPIEHVAFKLETAPYKIQVHDDDACELPESYPEEIKPYVLSIFKYDNSIASILNIAQLSLCGLQRA